MDAFHHTHAFKKPTSSRAAAARFVGSTTAVTQDAAIVQREKKYSKKSEAVTDVREFAKANKREILKLYLKRFYTNNGGIEAFDEQDQSWVEEAAKTVHFADAPKVEEGKRREVVRERKTLSANGWRHIWRGDISSKGRPSGFHWKGQADEAIHEGVDGMSQGAKGFYKQSVRLKTSVGSVGSNVDGKKVKNIDKEEQSTFFPDTWSESDVKDAIELRNGEDQIVTPKKGEGINLVKSGDTIYPLI